MTEDTLEIILAARDSMAECETFAQALDIELQEASLGMVTSSSTKEGAFTIRLEVNDQPHALQLIRSLLRTSEMAESTHLRVLHPNGEPETLSPLA